MHCVAKTLADLFADVFPYSDDMAEYVPIFTRIESYPQVAGNSRWTRCLERECLQ